MKLLVLLSLLGGCLASIPMTKTNSWPETAEFKYTVGSTVSCPEWTDYRIVFYYTEPVTTNSEWNQLKVSTCDNGKIWVMRCLSNDHWGPNFGGREYVLHSGTTGWASISGSYDIFCDPNYSCGSTDAGSTGSGGSSSGGSSSGGTGDCSGGDSGGSNTDTQSTKKTSTTSTTTTTTTRRPPIASNTTHPPPGTCGAYTGPEYTQGGVPNDADLNAIYGEVLAKSILFYEAQRSGKLPSSNRIPWRSDSAINDGDDVGIDLTGGWYDAGDHVKFNFPMAWSVTTLAWGLIEFRDAYIAAGQLDCMYESIKWPLDYLLKCWRGNNVLYGQVGDGNADHSFWGRAEDMTMAHPSGKITGSQPGTDLASETAAALAASSIAFKERDPAYSQQLLDAAKKIFNFAATAGKEVYNHAIPNSWNFYKSWSGWQDEFAWGAAWLKKATGSMEYDGHINLSGGNNIEFSWDSKTPGTAALMYEMTGSNEAKQILENFNNYWANMNYCGYDGCMAPKGLAWLRAWGPNRYSANAVLISIMGAKYGIMTHDPVSFAKGQIHYMLGLKDNQQKSFVVGFGNNPPQRPHHRSRSRQ